MYSTTGAGALIVYDPPLRLLREPFSEKGHLELSGYEDSE